MRARVCALVPMRERVRAATGMAAAKSFLLLVCAATGIAAGCTFCTACRGLHASMSALTLPKLDAAAGGCAQPSTELPKLPLVLLLLLCSAAAAPGAGPASWLLLGAATGD